MQEKNHKIHNLMIPKSPDENPEMSPKYSERFLNISKFQMCPIN